jgi:hypothetical protein
MCNTDQMHNLVHGAAGREMSACDVFAGIQAQFATLATNAQCHVDANRSIDRVQGVGRRRAMDGRRFDDIARALARPVRRRLLVFASGVTALVGVASGGQPARARQGTVLNQTGNGFGPGESCVTDYQCDNSFPELGILYCADNGYVYGAYGGTLHCCRYERGTCGGPLSDNHAACCGALRCNGGVCS